MGADARHGFNVSRLLRCLRYDAIAGCRFTLIPLGVIAVLCVVLFAGAYSYSRFFHIDVSNLSSSDALGLVLAGATRFEWRPGLPARLPLGWLALMGFVLYASLVYPAFDMRASGGWSMLAAGSRRIWLLSKMLWVGLVTVAAACVMAIACLAISCAVGLPLGVEVHDAALQLAMVSLDSIVVQAANIVPFVCGALAVLLTLAEAQLVIALFLHPIVAFGVCMAYLVVGYFVQSPLLLGNGAMLARWGGTVGTGVAGHEVVAVSAALCAAACAIGMWAIGKLDIYEKEA